MPRVPQDYLDCVVYLYRNEEDANQGQPKGGTGFLVGVPGEENADLKIFIVTNAHVAFDSGCNVVRFSRGGKLSICTIESHKWVRHRHGDDVAAARYEHPDIQSLAYVSIGALLSHEMIEEFGIRPGMEAFMIGRLTGLDGLQQTNPSIRFGHLAMMAEPVLRDNGLRQESFLVDLWSLAGYSGSPVFIFETNSYFRGDHENRLHDICLLGINWGFYRKHEPVMNGRSPHTKDTGLWIDGNSGFACVVPGWKIAELLDEHELNK
jgi:hypothetical protein